MIELDNSLNFVFHTLDTPPHGTTYNDDSGDIRPKGCCDISYEPIYEVKRQKNIIYKIMKINSSIN